MLYITICPWFLPVSCLYKNPEITDTIFSIHLHLVIPHFLLFELLPTVLFTWYQRFRLLVWCFWPVSVLLFLVDQLSFGFKWKVDGRMLFPNGWRIKQKHRKNEGKKIKSVSLYVNWPLTYGELLAVLFLLSSEL